MPQYPYSQKEYECAFSGQKKKNALEQVLDIRKFEIELYWKRASYFWTFIAAAFTGFFAIQSSDSLRRTDLSVFLSCIGLVFSVGWFFANRGSKQWQENWENHLDMLEDDEIGPLYKVVLARPKPEGFCDHISNFINGPAPISVTKVNQLISIFVSLIWVFLLIYSLWPTIDISAPFNGYYIAIIVISILFCFLFMSPLGKTHKGEQTHLATKRETGIEPKE